MIFGEPDAVKPPVRFDEGRDSSRELTTAVRLIPHARISPTLEPVPRGETKAVVAGTVDVAGGVKTGRFRGGPQNRAVMTGSGAYFALALVEG